MRIISKGDRFIADFPDTNVVHRWLTGSHTVNVLCMGKEVDCYTFAWAKDKPSMLDFTSALETYLSEA